MDISQPTKFIGILVKGVARFLSTGAMLLPVGTTAQRPSLENGIIRYNSDTHKFEKVANGAWTTEITTADIEGIIEGITTLLLTTPQLNSATLADPLISGASIATSTFTGGTVSGATVSNPTITGAALGATNSFSGTITNPTNTFQTLSNAGATISWNASLGQVAQITLNGNKTMAAPSNLKVGPYLLHVYNDATGTKTMTWNAAYKFPYGVAPDISGVNACTIVSLVFDGTTLRCGYTPGF